MRPRRWSKSKKSALNSTDAPSEAPAPAPRIIPRSEHTVSRSGISPNALRVLHRLREGGFQAFPVGGCVRDLLIGMEPKDFDVATDALPEDVKKLFRNCRLIGRRFRLAHVFFGRETIEVATFRAAAAPELGEETPPDSEGDDGDAQPLESAEDFEAEIAAELDDDEGGEGEDEEFIDTVTLLPDDVMRADLVEDPIEKTAVMPAPPTPLLQQQLAAASDADANARTMEMPALNPDALRSA